MRNVSAVLRERLEAQRGTNPPPLPVSRFVWVAWPLDAHGQKTVKRCYSTLVFAVTMNGDRYDGEARLLDFNEKDDERPFVMCTDHLLYGASCGFRVYDGEGLARNVVTVAKATGEFPAIYCESWLHVSEDPAEIESLRYGALVFGGHITRIELQEDSAGRKIAKVWGGYEGVAVSKARPDTQSAASVVVRRDS